MYEGASFTAARLTFKSLDNAAGKSPNLSILEMSRAWDLLYNIKLVRIRQNGDGCTPEMDVIYLSDYYFISEP